MSASPSVRREPGHCLGRLCQDVFQGGPACACGCASCVDADVKAANRERDAHLKQRRELNRLRRARQSEGKPRLCPVCGLRRSRYVGALCPQCCLSYDRQRAKDATTQGLLAWAASRARRFERARHSKELHQ